MWFIFDDDKYDSIRIWESTDSIPMSPLAIDCKKNCYVKSHRGNVDYLSVIHFMRWLIAFESSIETTEHCLSSAFLTPRPTQHNKWFGLIPAEILIVVVSLVGRWVAINYRYASRFAWGWIAVNVYFVFFFFVSTTITMNGDDGNANMARHNAEGRISLQDIRMKCLSQSKDVINCISDGVERGELRRWEIAFFRFKFIQFSGKCIFMGEWVDEDWLKKHPGLVTISFEYD